MANKGVQAMKYVSGTYSEDEFNADWLMGNSLSLLQYAISGSSMDWVKAHANISYSYALELRPREQLDIDHNGFLAEEDDIEKSGLEVIAGLNAAIQAILERIWHDQHQPNSPLAMPIQKEHDRTLGQEMSHAIGYFASWLMSAFQ